MSMELLKGKQNLSQTEILGGLKRNVRFYPRPGTNAFQKLPMIEQEAARAYFERDQDRVDRIMKEYEEENR